MLPIYGRSQEPQPGNTLFYHRKDGTLQNVQVSEHSNIMPVTRDGAIVGYVHAHNKPEFLYSVQWIAVPYTGGPVHYKVNPDTFPSLPYHVVKVEIDDTHTVAYNLGANLSKLRTAQVEMPQPTSRGSYEMRIKIPLAPESITEFTKQLVDTFVNVGYDISVTDVKLLSDSDWPY